MSSKGSSVIYVFLFIIFALLIFYISPLIYTVNNQYSPYCITKVTEKAGN